MSQDPLEYATFSAWAKASRRTRLALAGGISLAVVLWLCWPTVCRRCEGTTINPIVVRVGSSALTASERICGLCKGKARRIDPIWKLERLLGAETDMESERAHAARTKKEAAKAYAKSLQLTHEIREAIGGAHQFFGTVKNQGQRVVSAIEIVLYFLDDSGVRIGEERIRQGFLLSPLKPHYVGEIRSNIDPAPAWSGKVEVEISSVKFNGKE